MMSEFLGALFRSFGLNGCLTVGSPNRTGDRIPNDLFPVAVA